MSPYGEALLTAPDGTRWVLEKPGTRTDGRDDLVKYDNPQYKNNVPFTYERLTSMRRRIRLLRLLPGSDLSEIVCELFEAELKHGKAYLPSTGTEIPYEALSWSWGTGCKDNLILLRKRGANERAKASESLVVSASS